MPGYHETSLDEDMASASGLRHFLADHPQMSDQELALLLDQIPEALHASVKELIHDGQFLFADDTSLLLHYALTETQNFTEIASLILIFRIKSCRIDIYLQVFILSVNC